MATAQVYIKRFYTRTQIRHTNPYLVIATALYLACKMEECPQHIRLLTQEARSLWPTDLHGHDAARVGECEFALIAEMRCQLIVHQPYRTLLAVQERFGLAAEEAALAWTVVNDSYMTDLPLLHPPHVVALTAVLLALVLRPSSSSSGGGGGGGGGSGGSGGGNNASSGGGGGGGGGGAGGGNGGGGGGNSPALTAAGGSAAGGVAMAATALAQAQARVAALAAGSGGQGAPGSGQGDGAAAEPKKATDPRLAKVQRFAAWLADSSIDIEAMVDCTQELISFYECHEQYNDKHTREQISRFIKARALDK
ncbi:hypothetical protein VTK26DRAFT_4370 [Humicola hyalothermophila]